MTDDHIDYIRQASFRFSLRSAYTLDNGQKLLWQYYNERKLDESPKIHDYDFCWACVGLLTYGELDVMNDLIDHLPPLGISYGGTRVKLLSQAVVYILPLPDNLNDSLGRYIRRYRQEFRDWFQENEANLIWNGQEGTFNLKDETSHD